MYTVSSRLKRFRFLEKRKVLPPTHEIFSPYLTLRGVMSFLLSIGLSLMPPNRRSCHKIIMEQKKTKKDDDNAPFSALTKRKEEENKLIISFDVGKGGGGIGVLERERKSNSHCYYSNRNPIYIPWLFLVLDPSSCVP